jgi:hypothetical protein
MPLPETPTHLGGDYAHPRGTIRQAFQWNPYGTEWRLMVVDHAGEYAGFNMRKSYDFSAKLDGMVLYFELWPAEAAPALAIALLDGRSPNTRRMAKLPVAPYQIKRVDEPGWLLFSIPLTEFGHFMERVDDEEKRAEPTDPYSLDWSQISGARLLRLLQNPGQPRQIILRNLQFAPAIWVRE